MGRRRDGVCGGDRGKDEALTIAEIVDTLEGAPRQGAAVDAPEGSRYVVFSDTAMQRIARELRLAAAERPDVDSFGAERERR